MIYTRQCLKQFNKYQWTSSNQHGTRYKYAGCDYYNRGRLTASSDSADQMRQLILLSQMLRVPVEYDFDEQQAYIEVMAAVPRGSN